MDGAGRELLETQADYDVDTNGWSRQTYRGVDFFMRVERNEAGEGVTCWKFWLGGKKYGGAHIDPPGTFSPNLGVRVMIDIDTTLSLLATEGAG